MWIIWSIILCLSFIFSFTSASAKPSAEILIEFKEVKKINSYIFGNNVLAYNPCLHRKMIDKFCRNDGRFTNFAAGQWEPILRKPNSVLLRLAKEIKVSVFRFPGGCGTHHYNWKKAIGPLEKRPMYKFGVDEFMKLCEAVGSEPIITLSYFTGTCQDLADLVEYLNGHIKTNPNGDRAWAKVRAKNGHPEPYNVKWFEFGNEVWHGDHINISHVTPWEYAKRYLKCKQLIKNVDPTVLLGAVSTEGEIGLSYWGKIVAQLLGENLDFLILHIYRPGYYKNSPHMPPKELFKITLAAPDQIKDLLKNIENELKEVTGRAVPIAITEHNGSFIQQKPVPYRYSLGNALFIADLLRVFLTIDVPILCANYWHFSNGYWGLVYNPNYVKGKGNYYKRPNYYIFDLYANHFGKILLKTVVRSPGYTQPGFNKIKPNIIKSKKINIISQNYLPTIVKIDPEEWKVKKVQCVNVVKYKSFIELIFDCEKDINFFHVSYPVKLKAGYLYKLKAKIKAENLIDYGSGVRLEVQDLRGWKKVQFARSTFPVDGTTDWIPVELEFIPPLDSKGVRIIIRRCGGRSSIRGIVKVKDVEIKDLGPAPQYGPTSYISAIASTNEKKDKIYIMVINKNLDHPMRTLIKIDGCSFSPVVRAWILNGPSITATNEHLRERVKIHYKKVRVKCENGAFYFTFEPHSVTSLEVVKKED